jgi:GNAT superfamily N-acetyltransferase
MRHGDRFVVRAVSPFDGRVLAGVYTEGRTRSSWWDAIVEEVIPAKPDDGRGTLLVGTIGERVVAAGGIRPLTAWECEVVGPEVDPEYRRRGYGSTLLERLEARAVSEGYERTTVCVSDRFDQGEGFCERNGYRKDRREIRLDTGERRIYYEKRLESDPGTEGIEAIELTDPSYVSRTAYDAVENE